MTSRTLTMPRLGETMEEGTIVGWLVAPGQAFRRGAALVEIETDKTVVEYPALGDGTLEATLANVGERISVGDPIARVTVVHVEEWAATGTPVEAPSRSVDTAFAKHRSTATTRLRATPPARLLARKAGIALETVPGSGRRHRIERHDVERATLTRPHGRVAFDKIGEGGTTFLLLHGFAGDRSIWAATASGIARAGHCAIVADLPGHGASAAEARSLDDLTDIMTDFAVRLPGSLHLVGHSLGSAVAAGMAERLASKAARLTLIAPTGTGREIDREFILGMADATTPGEVARLVQRLGPKTDGLSEAMLAAMAQQLAQGRLKALARSLVGPQGQSIDILPLLAKLAKKLPVNVLIGKDDRIIPAAHAFNLPAGVAVHFLNAGHMPQWDALPETLSLLTGTVES